MLSSLHPGIIKTLADEKIVGIEKMSLQQLLFDTFD